MYKGNPNIYSAILLLLCIAYSIFARQVDTTGEESLPPVMDSLPYTKSTDTMSTDTLSDSTAKKVTKDTVRYEADVIEYDIDKKIILMKGNGVVKYKRMTLYADTIHFLFNEDMLVATGYPQLVEDNDTVVGDHMTYNLANGRGRVRYGTAHSEDSRYDGYSISRSGDKSFYITDGAYTSCAVEDSSHYYFYGRKIKVTPNDKAISKPVVLNIAQAPVMALPYYIQPLERGRQSGWLNPRWGGHLTHGGHLDNIGYYFAPNDYSDFKIAGKITEFTSYVLSANARYALRYWLSGGISARYSTSASYDTLNNLWAIDYTHNQNLLPDESMKLSGRGSIVSGKSFYKSVSEDTTELLNQQIKANMSLTKSFKKINAYGSLTWDRTHNFKSNKVDQNLPSFSFNLNTRPLIPFKEDETVSSDSEDKEKWYHKISYSYRTSGSRKYSYDTEIGKEKSLYDHAGLGQDLSVSAPQTIFKWFNITPNFSLHHAIFDAYIDTTRKQKITLVPVYDTLAPDTCPYEIIHDTIVQNDDTLYVCSTSTVQDTYFVYDTTDFRLSEFKKYNTYYWNTGVSLSTKLYGIFPIKMFNFEGIRHTFSPSVSYTFYPEKELNRTFPAVNGVSYTGPRKRGQVIGFSFNNLFQGKTVSYKGKNKDEPVEKKFTILSANIGMKYDFEAEGRKWSPISLSASIPNKLIDFSYSSSFTPYSDDNELIFPKIMSYSIRLSPKFKGVSGTFWGGDFLVFEHLEPEDYMVGYGDLKTPGWNINFNPSYSFSRSRPSLREKFTTKKEYHLSTNARIQFTNIWSAAWSSKFDFTRNEFVNHSLNFTCDLECWDLKFDWYPSGFNRGYYYFIIKIKKHPDIKWVERS